MTAVPLNRFKVAEAFGNALRAARKERGISQEEMGFEADLDRTYSSLLERGQRNPTLLVVCKLARVLRIEPAQLVADTMAHMRGTRS
jgi:transcriptional regulator with XRE-family HTH domain